MHLDMKTSLWTWGKYVGYMCRYGQKLSTVNQRSSNTCVLIVVNALIL